MPLEVAIILISTIGTAIWTVLTWTEQEEKERKAEEEQIDALYVNPFLLAAQDLQALLYSILAEGKIEFFRREISHEGENEDEITYHEALEVVYVIIKYFGLAGSLYLYGSYTQDKTAIAFTKKISETFAEWQISGRDAFCFTFTKQQSLGKMFVERLMLANSTYPEFKVTPLYKFDKEIINSRTENEHLYLDISRTIEAIRRAKSADDLSGRDRLIKIQNQLVDLLNYIESKERFSLSSTNRKRIKLVENKITVYESALPKEIHLFNEWEKFINWLSPSDLLEFQPSNILISEARAQIVHKIKGRIRIKIPQLFGNESYAEQLKSLIQALAGVESVQVNQGAASVTVNYNNKQISETEFETKLLEIINQSR